MAVLFPQKQHYHYFGVAKLIAIYCNTKLYMFYSILLTCAFNQLFKCTSCHYPFTLFFQGCQVVTFVSVTTKLAHFQVQPEFKNNLK